MLDKLKQFKWLIILFLVVLVLSYFTYNHFQQSNTLKVAFEKNDRIEVLHRLLESEKYAPDIRKAGFTIPPDGAIRLEGVVYPLEIEGDIHLKISPPQKQAKDFQLFFITQVNEKQTHVAFVLDKNLNLLYSSYSQENAKGTREIVSISQSEEARLLKIVQSEINSFIKKMYQILYG
ncbi:thiol-disulfide isomerase [Streptococcus cristatus]|uniref:Thiol-disulfide isomerase n=1 Tax=Streptococcus cristatus TaxID=45634 RepID=A0A5B0DDS0_STRCR|nr:thiol-disulfide isomerase [Streptococcus cristatus]KAA0963149.1 thiol-disulfide isomerase [Streptococcus cristatus]